MASEGKMDGPNFAYVDWIINENDSLDVRGNLTSPRIVIFL